MNLTIVLEPETARRVQAAQSVGIDVPALVQGVLAALPPVPFPKDAVLLPDAENQALIRLIASWQAEDKTDDEAELTRRDHDNEAFMNGINANREAAGARRIY